ncbi:MAG: Flp pilus assembly complex ATPase component TadA [Deltaproteobacteria bacterium]|nr:Flp pilus assembly complex ATPase component TadA [Deltaproteobacteria bacterium]
MSSLSPLVDALRKMAASELHLVPGERIYVIRKGKRRDIGRDPVRSVAIEKLVAEVLGDSGLVAARSRQQTRRAEVDGLALDVVATATASGISACLRVVQTALAVNEIDLDMSDPPSSVIPASTGSFGRISSPPVLTLDVPSDVDMSAATLPPSRPASALEGILDVLSVVNGSDLHLAAGSIPAVRVDGALSFLEDRGIAGKEEVRSFVRGLADARALKEIDDRRDVRFLHVVPGGARFRVDASSDHGGMNAVIRRIAPESMPLETYGLPPEVTDALRPSRGLVLVAGMRCTGKTTLLASIVDHVNRGHAGAVVTIEDPVEIVHAHKRCVVRQRQVGDHVRTIVDALRSARNDDADVIVVSDLPSPEAVQLAIELADSGRLVVAGYPAATAGAVLGRILAAAGDAQPRLEHVLAGLPVIVIGQILCTRLTGGRIPAIELVLGGSVVASFADSLVALVRHGLVSAEEAWGRALDRDQIATAFHGAGIAFPS